MSTKTLRQVEVVTTAGKDIYYGTDAQSVLDALEATGARDAKWTGPIETITGECIDYNYLQVVKVRSFYRIERPEPVPAEPEHTETQEIEGAEEWDTITDTEPTEW